MTARSFAASLAHRDAARQHLVCGVSSSPRAVQRPVPILAERGEGAWIIDADGNRVIDYALGYGALILGHSPQAVLAAVQAQLGRGLLTAGANRAEADLAALIAECVPSAALSAFVSTGTEAVQLALRVARAATGRVKVIKFRANYHGWADSTHVAGGAGNDGPGALGQDPKASESLTILDWGDAEAVDQVLDESFAAVLLEPVAVNPGCFTPPPDYLARLRQATARHGVMLVFDEVITGFRFGLGGAQARYGVLPDISVLGKALGAGLPVGVVSGTEAALQVLADGALVHRGTFNGNPVSMAASVACLQTLMAEPGIFPRMEAYAAALAAHTNAEAARLGVAVLAQQAGPALQLFAGVDHLAGITDLVRVDRTGILRLTEALLCRGVQTIPRGLMYISAAHGDAEIETTMDALTAALAHFARAQPEECRS